MAVASTTTEHVRLISGDFDARDPAGWFARRGVELRAEPEWLRLPGRLVRGAWDPSIRRVTVFGCEEVESDAEVVRTLGHEMHHVECHLSRREGDRECNADGFGWALVEHLGAEGVASCAEAVRRIRMEQASRLHKCRRDPDVCRDPTNGDRVPDRLVLLPQEPEGPAR